MARDATLSISLTSQLKTYVHDKVQSGQFESASEVIRHSLRTLQEHERLNELHWPEIRRKVREARKAIAEGDIVDGPSFMQSRIAKLKSAAGKKTHKGSRKQK